MIDEMFVANFTQGAAASMPMYTAGDPLVAGFRQAMRRLTAAVSLITTENSGVRYGMTVTAVCSLGIKPPSLLISVSQSASMHGPVISRGAFSVNVLTDVQGELVRPFSGGVKGEARFAFGRWQRSPMGLPWLSGAQANFECRSAGTLEYAGHTIIVGSVSALSVEKRIAPLLYQDGGLAVSRMLS